MFINKKLIILFLISINSYSQIGDDKIKHFRAGALFSGSTNFVVYKLTGDTKKAFWYGLAAGVFAGVGKELLDEHKYNGWDNEDLMASALGSITIIIPLNLLEKKHKLKYKNVSKKSTR